MTSTLATTSSQAADAIAHTRDAFDFLITDHGMRLASARQSRERWAVTFTHRRHEVIVSSDDGRLIDVTVNGRDLRSQVLDLVSLGGMLPPSEVARLSALGRATGRRTPATVLDEHAALLQRHARWLLPD